MRRWTNENENELSNYTMDNIQFIFDFWFTIK